MRIFEFKFKHEKRPAMVLDECWLRNLLPDHDLLLPCLKTHLSCVRISPCSLPSWSCVSIQCDDIIQVSYRLQSDSSDAWLLEDGIHFRISSWDTTKRPLRSQSRERQREDSIVPMGCHVLSIVLPSSFVLLIVLPTTRFGPIWDAIMESLLPV